MNRAPNDPIASRTLLVKNLNFEITGPDLYDLFGRYGAIRQVRLGTDAATKTKGTAYVVYESPDAAREALNHLNGFQLSGRYLVVMYYHPQRQAERNAKAELEERERIVAEEKKLLGMEE